MLSSALTFSNLWHSRVAVSAGGILHFALAMLQTVSAGGILHFALAMLRIFVKNYSPSRKLVTWICYSAADFIFYASIVFPFVAQSYTDHQLIFLWAVLYYLLLGETGTITALSLEDNQLWQRRTFKVIVKGLIYVTVIHCFLRGMYNMLVLMTVLVLLRWLFDCGERILAHQWGSLDELRLSLQSNGRDAVQQDFASYESIATERSGVPAVVFMVEWPSQQLPVHLPPGSVTSIAPSIH